MELYLLVTHFDAPSNCSILRCFKSCFELWKIRLVDEVGNGFRGGKVLEANGRKFELETIVVGRSRAGRFK